MLFRKAKDSSSGSSSGSKEQEQQEIIGSRVEYKFQCGITAAQEESSYDQDIISLQILKSADIGELKNLTEIPFNIILEKIASTGVILKLIENVLIDKVIPEGKTFGDLKRSEYIKVLKDFFDLSPVLKSWSGIGKLKQVLSQI